MLHDLHISDPVYMGTQRFTHAQTDIEIDALFGTLGFTRTYRSFEYSPEIDVAAPRFYRGLGPNWSHAFEYEVVETFELPAGAGFGVYGPTGRFDNYTLFARTGLLATDPPSVRSYFRCSGDESVLEVVHVSAQAASGSGLPGPAPGQGDWSGLTICAVPHVGGVTCSGMPSSGIDQWLRMIRPDGSELVFTRSNQAEGLLFAHWRPLYEVKSDGRFLEFRYDCCNRLSRVVSASWWLEFEYPTACPLPWGSPACQEYISAVRTSDGRRVSFEYSGPAPAGTLTKATIQGKPGDTPRVWTYAHQTADGQALLTSIIDPLGRVMIQNVFRSGSFISYQWRYGERYDYSYEAAASDRVVGSVNRSGQIRQMHFDSLDGPHGGPVLKRLRERDGRVHPLDRVDHENRTWGNLRREALNELILVPPIRGTPGVTWRETVYEYTDTEDADRTGPDDEFRVRSVTYPDGSKVTTAYNFDRAAADRPASTASNEVIKRFWEAQTWKVIRTAPAVAGQPPIHAATEYEYRQFETGGSGTCSCDGIAPTAVIDAEGRRTDLEYVDGLLTRSLEPLVQTATEAYRAEHVYAYSSGGGRLESRTFPAIPGQSAPRRDEFKYEQGAPIPSPHVTRIRRGVSSTAGGPADSELRFEYDGAGDVIRAIDARNADTIFEYNGFRELTFVASRPGAGGERTRTWHRYDVMGNRVRTDVENRGADGQLVASNPLLTTIREYDHKNRLFRVAIESVPADVPPGAVTLAEAGNAANFAVTEFGYDAPHPTIPTLRAAEDFITSIRGPAVTSGQQPGGEIRLEYDEWNQLYRVTRGSGPGRSVTSYDYTPAGRLHRITQGADGTSAVPRVTTMFPDGLGRVPRFVAADGSELRQTFDLVGNALSRTLIGAADPGAPPTSVLAREVFEYDAMDRLTAATREVFDHLASPPGPVTTSTTRFEYEPTSHLRAVVDANGRRTAMTYDALHRPWKSTDPLGNIHEYLYDPSGNVSERRTAEINPLRPGVSGLRRTRVAFQYDPLDRLIEVQAFIAGNSAQVSSFSYDSRGNLVRTIDPRNNQTDHEYDALSRLVTTRRALGGGAEIVTSQSWDVASRVIAQIDDNGNATRYAYDDHDRLYLIRHADGMLAQVGDGASWPEGAAQPASPGTPGFDALGNALLLTAGKPGGRVRVEVTPDILGRVTARDVSLEGHIGVQATERFSYDGAGRLRRAWSTDAVRSTASMLERRYDSLSRLVFDGVDFDPQPFPNFDAVADAVQYQYDAEGNTTRVQYPGGRVVDWARDQLGRVSGIWDLPPPPPGQSPVPRQLAALIYAGSDRLIQQLNGNGTATEWTFNGLLDADLQTLNPADPDAPPPGDLGFSRITRVRHAAVPTPQNPAPQPFDAWTLTWDRTNNKRTRTQSGDAGIGGLFAPAQALYDYDALDRLISASVIVTGPEAEKDPRARSQETYALDGVHNRVSTQIDGQVSPYSLGGPASPTRRMNQYAASPLSVFAYDPRGNTRSESAHCRGDIFPRQPNGDIGDHRVNSSDLTRLLGQFSQPVTPENAECDINGDGQIGTSDLILLLGNLGNGCDWAEYAYDWADRLVEVKLSSFENGSAANPPRVEVHRYEYDALGRRIARTLFASGSVGSGVPQARCTRFIHGGVGTAADAVVGWQVLEEQDGTGETLATFVPSGRSGAVDEVVCFERDLIGSGLIENLGMAPTEPACGPPAPVAEDRREYWLHRDDQFSTTSVSDAQGQVVERYEYHDYGFPLILSAAGEPLGLNAQGLYASRVGNASLFTGREWDGESKLYHYRTRAYHPGLGRFMQIDRIGVWGDVHALGSGYVYCASSPLKHQDAFGEDVIDWAILGQWNPSREAQIAGYAAFEKQFTGRATNAAAGAVAGAATGGATGAVLGTAVPGAGTVTGGLIGAAGGAIGGVVTGIMSDPDLVSMADVVEESAIGGVMAGVAAPYGVLTGVSGPLVDDSIAAIDDVVRAGGSGSARRGVVIQPPRHPVTTIVVSFNDDYLRALSQRGKPLNWTLIRQRFWKREAELRPWNYDPDTLERMRDGLAPLHQEYRVPMELHHPNGRNGDNIYDVTPVWPWEHDALDPCRHYRGPRPD